MSEAEDDSSISKSRRRLVKGLSLIPVVAAAGNVADAAEKYYEPHFFSADEWAFIVAICDRLIPADEIGPGAVELGVPEFLDRHMQTPYASGAIWYMQGPFLEAAAEFGYQGRLPLREILRVGIAEMNAHCSKAFAGKTFAQLTAADQESLLEAAEAGALQFESISSRLFFAYLLA